MNKFMKKRKMRGFTLVELLIVIIIIGILAGSLLLVAGAGTDKAEATKIASNMRNIKAAALMYYADNGSWPTAGSLSTELVGYIDFELDDSVWDIKSVPSVMSVDLMVEYKGTVPEGVFEKMRTLEAAIYDNTGALVQDNNTTTGDYSSNLYMPLK
jgi:general secretion pathway protein G